jgi:S-adenosylmethionine hydrolase
MDKLKFVFIVFIAAAINLNALSQAKAPAAKIKSIVVTEEKSDMLVKKQFKESETYYDSHGNIIEEISYKDGKVSKHMKYQFDQDNNKIKEEELDSSGHTIETSEYKYLNGLRSEKIVYDSGKKMKSRKVYTYTMYQE